MTELNTQSLAYMVDAVQEDLGDIQGLFSPSQIARFVNEGQRRLEPELMREMSSALTWADNATSTTLPTDLDSIVAIDPTDTTSQLPSRYRIHAGKLYFDQRDTVYAFTGTLYYRAHWPQISDSVDCKLPATGVDALLHYAMYKCFHRIASNRSEYRRYSTLAQNGVSVADIEAIAQNHLADFADAKTGAQNLPQPSFFTEDI